MVEAGGGNEYNFTALAHAPPPTEATASQTDFPLPDNMILFPALVRVTCASIDFVGEDKTKYVRSRMALERMLARRLQMTGRVLPHLVLAESCQIARRWMKDWKTLVDELDWTYNSAGLQPAYLLK